MSDYAIIDPLPKAPERRPQQDVEEEMIISTSTKNGSLAFAKLSSLKSFEEYESSLVDQRCRSCLRSLHVTPPLFEFEGFRSPTTRKAKHLIRSIKQLEALEEVSFHGKMYLENIHDVEVIKNAIDGHPSLRCIHVTDFVVYANDHPDTKPLLESLLASASTLSNLESLHLKCFANYRQWNRAFCTSHSLKSVCLSTRLECLSLSGLGLRDEHFLIMAQEIQNNKDTRLRELILNDNDNSDVGVCAMMELLGSNTSIERLESHSSKRLSQPTCETVLQAIDQNHLIQYFCANTHDNFRTKIDFCLLLNRTGRKAMLDPSAGPETIVDVLEAADGNVSILLALLRENPSICQVQERHEPAIRVSRCTIEEDQSVDALEVMEDGQVEPLTMMEEGISIWRGFWYRMTEYS